MFQAWLHSFCACNAPVGASVGCNGFETVWNPLFLQAKKLIPPVLVRSCRLVILMMTLVPPSIAPLRGICNGYGGRNITVILEWFCPALSQESR